MIKLAIVEDDETYIASLKDLLMRYEKESKIRLKISIFYDGEDIISRDSKDFDIILMDIEMDCIDGMTAAEEIRKTDDNVIIIFITNMPQYAMEGYKVDALDYVLKPISYFALSQRLDKAVKRLSQKESRYINFKQRSGFKRVDISRIYYIEVKDHDCYFYTMDGNFQTKDSLKNLETKLSDCHFFRCHKWFLVNMKHIESIQNYDIRVGDYIIQVSRARKKEILDALNNFMNEDGK